MKRMSRHMVGSPTTFASFTPLFSSPFFSTVCSLSYSAGVTDHGKKALAITLGQRKGLKSLRSVIVCQFLLHGVRSTPLFYHQPLFHYDSAFPFFLYVSLSHFSIALNEHNSSLISQQTDGGKRWGRWQFPALTKYPSLTAVDLCFHSKEAALQKHWMQRLQSRSVSLMISLVAYDGGIKRWLGIKRWCNKKAKPPFPCPFFYFSSACFTGKAILLSTPIRRRFDVQVRYAKHSLPLLFTCIPLTPFCCSFTPAPR